MSLERKAFKKDFIEIQDPVNDFQAGELLSQIIASQTVQNLKDEEFSQNPNFATNPETDSKEFKESKNSKTQVLQKRENQTPSKSRNLNLWFLDSWFQDQSQNLGP